MSTTIDKFHLALKQHFRRNWRPDVFDEIFKPLFSPGDAYVIGSPIKYELLDTLHFEMVAGLINFSIYNNVNFVIAGGIDFPEIHWFIKDHVLINPDINFQSLNI